MCLIKLASFCFCRAEECSWGRAVLSDRAGNHHPSDEQTLWHAWDPRLLCSSGKRLRRSAPSIPQSAHHLQKPCCLHLHIWNHRCGRQGGMMSKHLLFFKCWLFCASGLPKAAVLNQNRLLSALAVLSSNGITSKDVFYLNLPLYHTAGFIVGFIGCIETGETIQRYLWWLYLIYIRNVQIGESGSVLFNELINKERGANFKQQSKVSAVEWDFTHWPA